MVTKSQNPPTGNFQALVTAIAAFCEAQLSYGPSGRINYKVANDLVQKFKNLFPLLVKQFPEEEDYIFSASIINFGVDGLLDKNYRAIWEKHFLEGQKICDLATDLKWSYKKTRRAIDLFPKRVTDQLVSKNYEIYSSQIIAPWTTKQTIISHLHTAFGFTQRQGEVMWEFLIHNTPVGRKIIRDHLGIERDTLHDHIKRIIHKMGASDMNEAVQKVREFLQWKGKEDDNVE